MVTGGGANSLVRVTDDGVLVVNTKNRSQASYDAFMAQIKMISDKPIKYASSVTCIKDKSGNTSSSLLPCSSGRSRQREGGLKTYTNAAGTPELECHL